MSQSGFFVKLDGASLEERGRTLSLELCPGDTYAVMGPSGAGKSLLLDVMTGEIRPVRGQAVVQGRAVRPNNGTYSRRATPATVARANTRSTDTAQIVAVLSALHLWDLRDTPVTKLPTGLAIATDLIPLFLQPADLLVVDGLLDYLDPWLLEDLLELLDQQVQEGRAALVATSRPDIAEALGNLIVLKSKTPRFAGTCRELIEQSRPAELFVEVDDESTVRTMVEPFTVSIKSRPDGLELTSHAAQDLAARLLTQGYGQIRTIILKEPTLKEAIHSLY